MIEELAIERYLRWYRRLIGLYSRTHHVRFSEGMEQSFRDLCRERLAAHRSLLPQVLWIFIETSADILKHPGRSMIMQDKGIKRIALMTGCLLLAPILGNIFVDGWNWAPFDFIVWGAIVFGAGFTYRVISAKFGSAAYRIAVSIACLTGFFLVLVNAAVGIIGDEELANAMYFGVLVVAFIGAYRARFQPRSMSRALFVTAAAQALVPLIAMLWVTEENFAPGRLPVLGLNAVFVALWMASAMLFRHAAEPWQKGPVTEIS